MIKKLKKISWPEMIITLSAFVFFFVITCYKLTNSGIWYDEAFEYWYSKFFIAPLPFPSMELNNDMSSMYDRIVSTYQPPLCNFVLYFWLKICDTEWWFRFFGVVMGFICNLGIFMTIKKLFHTYFAAASVFVSSCIYQLVFYWQETAEYAVMLAAFSFVMYYFVCVYEDQSLNNIIKFTIASVLAIYSQYGVVFVIIPMMIAVFIWICMKKDIKKILQVIYVYAISGILFGIPLIYFFLLKQMQHQQTGRMAENAVSMNMWQAYVTVFRWNFMSGYGNTISTMAAVAFLILLLLMIFVCQKKVIRQFGIISLISWFLYYFAVKKGLYAHTIWGGGGFGYRYNIFFVTLWFVDVIMVVYEIFDLIGNIRWKQVKWLKACYICMFVVCMIIFMVSSFNKKLKNNWIKEDARGMVNSWKAAQGTEIPTIVHFFGRAQFAYYLHHLDDYNSEMEENIYYIEGSPVNFADYTYYFDYLFPNGWPDSVILVDSRVTDNFNIACDVFWKNGYVATEIFNQNNGKCLRFDRKADE